MRRYEGTTRHSYIKCGMWVGTEKNDAGGSHVRGGYADNKSVPHRRPMSIITLMYICIFRLLLPWRSFFLLPGAFPVCGTPLIFPC